MNTKVLFLVFCFSQCLYAADYKSCLLRDVDSAINKAECSTDSIMDAMYAVVKINNNCRREVYSDPNASMDSIAAELTTDHNSEIEKKFNAKLQKCNINGTAKISKYGLNRAIESSSSNTSKSSEPRNRSSGAK